MYGRLYGAFQDWIEKAGERAYYHFWSRVFTWSIPELARLRSHRDRVNILLVATAGRPQPRWRRWLTFLGLIVFAPVLGMYIGWRLASLVLPMGKYLPLLGLIVFGCGMLGFLLWGLAGHFIMLNRTRPAVYRVLANLDEAICPMCGYDLKGHLSETIEHDIRCPECATVVPRLTRTGEDPHPMEITHEIDMHADPTPPPARAGGSADARPPASPRPTWPPAS